MSKFLKCRDITFALPQNTLHVIIISSIRESRAKINLSILNEPSAASGRLNISAEEHFHLAKLMLILCSFCEEGAGSCFTNTSFASSACLNRAGNLN